MNTQLMNTMVESEGRYLTEEERERFRGYALGMRDRIDRARRLEELEDELVEGVQRYVQETHGASFAEETNREKISRDVRLHLRYIALAHINDDLPWFVSQYAEWIAQMISMFTAPETLVAAYERLGTLIGELLDPADARELERFNAAFVQELRTQ